MKPWIAATLSMLCLLISCEGATYVRPDPDTAVNISSNQQQSVNGPPKRILCFGDSLTAGYQRQSADFWPYGQALQDALGDKAVVDSVGFCGWTTGQMLAGADYKLRKDSDACRRGPGIRNALQEKHYDLVILMAGTNDVVFKVDEEVIASNLYKLYDLCREYTVGRVLAIEMPDFGDFPNSQELSQKRDRVSAAIEDYARSHRNYTRFLRCPVTYRNHEVTGFYEPLGLHFSRLGYSTLGRRLAPVVEEILQQEEDTLM